MDEDLKGSVDFDFFDDSNTGSEIRETSARVAGKPPLPERNSPVKFDRHENWHHTDTHSSPTNDRNDQSIDDKDIGNSDSSDDYNSDFESKSDSEDSSGDDDDANLKEIAEINNASHIRHGREKDSQSNEKNDENSNCSSSAYSVSDSDSSSELHRHGKNKSDRVIRTKFRKSDLHINRDVVDTHSEVRKNGWFSDSHSGRDTFKDSSSNSKQGINKSISPKRSDLQKLKSEVNSCKKINAKCLKQKRNEQYTEGVISNSGSDSEGEITDVSPLASPSNTPRLKKKNKQFAVIDARTIGNHGQGSSSIYDDGDRRVDFPAQDSIEFKLLMKAVQELDNDKEQRLKASRRVMFAPPSHSASNRQSWPAHHPSQCHSEATFSREQARLIERENQRLLKTILNKGSQSTSHKLHQVSGSDVSRAVKHSVWHSATNRQKQQRLIDLQNMELLKRLQHIRPSKGLSRDEQLDDFHTKTLYGSPIYNTSSQRKPCPYSDTDASMLSMSSIESVSQPVTQRSVSSRQSSRCTSRPSSARRVIVDHRPEWNSRW